MSEIQLQQVRYRGDIPGVEETFQNPGYQPDSQTSRESINGINPSTIYPIVDPNANDHYHTKPFKVNEVDLEEGPTGSYSFDDAEQEYKSDPDDEEPPNKCLHGIAQAQTAVFSCLGKNKKILYYIFIGLLIAGYFAYFGYAMYYERLEGESSVRLLWVTCVVVFFVLLSLILRCCGEQLNRCMDPCLTKMAPHETLISWIMIAAIFLAIIVFVFVDVFTNTKQYYNLVSGAGILIYVFVFFIFSVNPAKVQWRAVCWGLGLQFVFAIIILRWEAGFKAFKWVGDRVTEFLDHSDAGAKFLFGDPSYLDHFFAFKVLPTIVFFSTVISILYYWGAMQVIVRYVAAVMQFAMGTTAGESLNAAGNIFVGQTEAPLLIRPLLPHMTKSELHAVMTGGFATIAGGVLAAYIGFGVPANHLLSASVMSAPAALAMAKLFYPETEKSRTTAKDVKKLPKSEEVNFISAAANGASQSIALVANVAVNLLAFISILWFIDQTLIWFGHRVGLYEPELTFRLICSYVLYPLALIMGVDLADCRSVASLIGVKTFLNEFVAYADMSVLIKNREQTENHTLYNGTWNWQGDNVLLYPLPGYNETVTLVGGFLTARSEVITTYALCGFANIGSIGIQLGGLGAMAPGRRADLARVAVRAMIAGNVACFMTACIAGLFFQG